MEMYCCWVCCSIWQHGKDLYDTKKVPSTSYIIIFLFVVQLLDIYNEEHLVKCLHSLIYYCFAFTRVEFSWKHIFFWKFVKQHFCLQIDEARKNHLSTNHLIEVLITPLSIFLRKKVSGTQFDRLIQIITDFRQLKKKKPKSWTVYYKAKILTLVNCCRGAANMGPIWMTTKLSTSQCGNYGNLLSTYLWQNFVKVTFLLNKWFDEIFSVRGNFRNFHSVCCVIQSLKFGKLKAQLHMHTSVWNFEILREINFSKFGFLKPTIAFWDFVVCTEFWFYLVKFSHQKIKAR